LARPTSGVRNDQANVTRRIVRPTCARSWLELLAAVRCNVVRSKDRDRLRVRPEHVERGQRSISTLRVDHLSAGWMFWFPRKKFVGSYFCLSAASRW
jgi:hypothetical protein